MDFTKLQRRVCHWHGKTNRNEKTREKKKISEKAKTEIYELCRCVFDEYNPTRCHSMIFTDSHTNCKLCYRRYDGTFVWCMNVLFLFFSFCFSVFLSLSILLISIREKVNELIINEMCNKYDDNEFRFRCVCSIVRCSINFFLFLFNLTLEIIWIR